MSFDDEEEATVMVPTFGPGAFFAERYRIDALLGSGAMGRVYSAVEMHTGRKVALKVLHKERLGEEETVERFRREAEVLASIGHPCIVQVYAFHHASDGTPYLAMELLEGVTLKTRLSNLGRFQDPLDYQEILDGICGALSMAHSRGVVHRDMKPDNIFLPATGDPRAKLVDFGLSRMAANPRNKNLTHSGMILGTPRYMAPEQIRNASIAGPHVDIYSVGVVAFECLTGQSPYPAQDYGQLLGCVLEGRVTPLAQLRPDLPSTLGAVLKKAMDPEPATRFQSCDELADAYGHAIGSPSRRKQIAVRAKGEAPRQRRVSVSQQNVQASKGGTLALDLSAAREELLGLPGSVPPPPMDNLTMSYGDASPGDVFSGDITDQNPLDPPPPVATTPFRPSPQAYLPPPAAPEPYSNSAYPPAKGGDTLFMPSAHPPAGGQAPTPGPLPVNAVPAGMLSSPASSFGGGGLAPSPSYGGGGPSPAPSFGGGPVPSYGAGIPHTPVPHGQLPSHAAASFSNAPIAAPPAANKRRGGWGLFLVAMIVVIIVAALGGFAVRSYMQHGELVLPWAPRTE